MTAQYGRTTTNRIRFIIGDTANTLRCIPVTSMGDVGLTYEQVDVTAWMDKIKGYLSGMPSFGIDISGPLDTTAAAVSPSLSGSHTVLAPINGVNTPRSLDIQIGIGHDWEAGEPQFGISRSTTSGIIVTRYTVNGNTYTAHLDMFAGSDAPAWGTAAEV